MDSTKIDGAFPRTQALERTAKTDAIPGAGKGGTSAAPVRSETENATSTQAKPVQSVNAQYDTSDTRLPFAILNDTRLANAEWAWRNLLFAAVLNILSDAEAEPATVSESTPQVEQGTNVLWTLLSSLPTKSSLSAQSTAQPSWQSTWNGEVSENHLIPFRTVTHEQWAVQNNTVKHWVLQDRLASSVQTSPYERSGGGMFVPQEISRPSESAVRWTATRQTKLASQGRLVHRIEFEVMVGSDMLKCTLTSSTPTLLLHFETDNHRLRNHLAAGKAIVQPLLTKHGYDVHQWSVSPLLKAEEE